MLPKEEEGAARGSEKKRSIDNVNVRECREVSSHFFSFSFLASSPCPLVLFPRDSYPSYPAPGNAKGDRTNSHASLGKLAIYFFLSEKIRIIFNCCSFFRYFYRYFCVQLFSTFSDTYFIFRRYEIVSITSFYRLFLSLFFLFSH